MTRSRFGHKLVKTLLDLANITCIFPPFWVGFAVSGLDSNQNRETALSGLASNLEADVKSEQGFIYPHETAERSGEKELFLAPGKKIPPGGVAVEVLFLFPQQPLMTNRAAQRQVQERQQKQMDSEQPPGPCYHTDRLSGEGGRKEE